MESDLLSFQRVRKICARILALTHESNNKHQKHAAAIVHNRKIVASACNEGEKTNPKATKYKMECGHLVDKLHAEMAAIYLAPTHKVVGSTLVVARSRGRNSKPCDVCMHHIKEAGIKNIIYSTPNGFVKEIVNYED